MTASIVIARISESRVNSPNFDGVFSQVCGNSDTDRDRPDRPIPT